MGKRKKAKIRGVYATALTRLLLDYDFEIVQPSEWIAERLSLEAFEREPDLTIRDRPDRQGVEANGCAQAVGALRLILRQELFDVVLRKVDGGLDAEFPWAAKMKLDEYRGAVVPTVRMHHYYKAFGGEVSAATDMAERLLLQGYPEDEVEDLLRRTIAPYLPFEGSEVGVEHVKLDGAALSLGKAVIEDYEESMIKYRRKIRSGGVYDGLDVEKEVGDSALTEARLGEYYTVTRYFSEGGGFKGAYINLSTPVELYPSKVRYVDLEVDVCVWPGGELMVVDEELLERAAKENTVTEMLLETVRMKVDELLTLIGGDSQNRPISHARAC